MRSDFGHPAPRKDFAQLSGCQPAHSRRGPAHRRQHRKAAKRHFCGPRLARIFGSRYFLLSPAKGCDLLLDLRHFAPRTEALDDAWFSCACSGNSWTPTGEQWGTNNGPIKVVDAADNAGVQKPGKIGVTNPHTAATEKIAEDLSKLVWLPVPAITLDERGAAAGEPRFVAVSAGIRGPGYMGTGRAPAIACPKGISDQGRQCDDTFRTVDRGRRSAERRQRRHRRRSWKSHKRCLD